MEGCQFTVRCLFLAGVHMFLVSGVCVFLGGVPLKTDTHAITAGSEPTNLHPTPVHEWINK